MTIKYRNLAFASLAGILLFCSFPPLEYSVFAWIALISLIYLCFSCKPGESFLYGLLSGVVFWLGSIFWLTKVSFIGWFFIGLYCAFYFALFASVVSWWLTMRRLQSSGKGRGLLCDLPVLFGAPAIWVGLEYARSVFLTGFPWNLLGVSQYSYSRLIQCADWGGVYLVSYLIIMGNTAIALMVYHRREGILKPAIGLVSFLLILFMVLEYGKWRLLQSPEKLETIRAAAVQSNVPQQMKWSEEWADDIYRRLKKSTAAACKAAPLDLIVWPETALPDFVRSSGPSRSLVNDSRRHGVPLLVGSMDLEELPDKTNYFNSSFLFLPGQERPKVMPQLRGVQTFSVIPDLIGNPEKSMLDSRFRGNDSIETNYPFINEGLQPQVYAKRHLVLFGEYIPFADYFPFLRSITGIEEDFTPGRTNVIFRLNGGGQNFSVLICFEDTLPYLARECVRSGARLLINQTNDAWFDPSWASRQHMIHCVFRCIENRVACLRATNTGLTCYIDRFGLIRSSLAPLGREPCSEATQATPEASPRRERVLQGAPEVLRADACFSPENMPLTFYTRHGDIFGLACAAFSLPIFLGFLLNLRKKAVKILPSGKKSSC